MRRQMNPGANMAGFDAEAAFKTERTALGAVSGTGLGLMTERTALGAVSGAGLGLMTERTALGAVSGAGLMWAHHQCGLIGLNWCRLDAGLLPV